MCYKSSLTGSEGLLLKTAKVLLGSINKEPDVVLANFFRLIINSLIIHKLSNLSSPLKSVTCSCQTKNPGGVIWFQSEGSAGQPRRQSFSLKKWVGTRLKYGADGISLHWYSLFKNFILISILYIKKILIECFHSRCQHLCKFIGTKESVCIRKEFNSHRIGLGHQHGRKRSQKRHCYQLHWDTLFQECFWSRSTNITWKTSASDWGWLCPVALFSPHTCTQHF